MIQTLILLRLQLRILLSCLDLCQVLLRQQIYDHLICLFLLHRSEEHLDENAELLEIPSLVCDLLNILLLEISAPYQTLYFRLYIDDHAILGIKAAHLKDRKRNYILDLFFTVKSLEIRLVGFFVFTYIGKCELCLVFNLVHFVFDDLLVR